VNNIAPFIYQPSTTINADTDGPVFKADYYNSCYFILDVTEVGASQWISLLLYGYDPVVDGVAGAAATLLIDSAPQVSSVSTQLGVISQGARLPQSAQFAAPLTVNLPLYWKFRYNVNNANNMTFSIGIVPIRCRE
jgi:hypothetical protein